MSLTAEQLACIPLFAGLSTNRLVQLASVFERLSPAEDTVLFEPNQPATHFYVLTAGEVMIWEGEQVRCQLWPLATIGELGCLAGLDRVTRAVVTQPSELWRTGPRLDPRFFDQHTDIALPFYQQLVNLIAEKVHRDQIRIEDMRRNIIRTQKTMKQMRDYLLESPDTPVSETLHNRSRNSSATTGASTTGSSRPTATRPPCASMTAPWRRSSRSRAPTSATATFPVRRPPKAPTKSAVLDLSGFESR